jgi:hypothetical protein
VFLDANGNVVDANGNPDTIATPLGSPTGATNGYVNPAPSGAVGLPATGVAPTTDEQWTAAVQQDLEGIGYDPQVVATAIANYLASQSLTAAQVTIIRTAWAYEGRPPQHPNLPIVQSTGTTPPPSGNPGGPIQGGNPPTPTPKPPAPVPVPVPTPKPPVSTPQYVSVTVVKFANPAPWNSTISGIASHYGYGGNWQAVWNDPKNATLKTKRGQPNLIQPGDVVYVLPK